MIKYLVLFIGLLVTSLDVYSAIVIDNREITMAAGIVVMNSDEGHFEYKSNIPVPVNVKGLMGNLKINLWIDGKKYEGRCVFEEYKVNNGVPYYKCHHGKWFRQTSRNGFYPVLTRKELRALKVNEAIRSIEENISNNPVRIIEPVWIVWEAYMASTAPGATFMEESAIAPGKSESVQKAQQRLKELGYDPGKIDGIWGRKTSSAIKQFQKDSGLDSSGTLNSETEDALGLE